MLIHFNMAEVRELLAHSKAAPKHRQTVGAKNQGYGLWLVGDEGVYLMSNGDPGLTPGKNGKKHRSVQCKETDIKDPAEQHRMKTLIFGGDDGFEFLPGEEVEKSIGSYAGPEFLFEILSDKFAFVIHDTLPKPRRRKRA